MSEKFKVGDKVVALRHHFSTPLSYPKLFDSEFVIVKEISSLGDYQTIRTAQYPEYEFFSYRFKKYEEPKENKVSKKNRCKLKVGQIVVPTTLTLQLLNVRDTSVTENTVFKVTRTRFSNAGQVQVNNLDLWIHENNITLKSKTVPVSAEAWESAALNLACMLEDSKTYCKNATKNYSELSDENSKLREKLVKVKTIVDSNWLL